MRFVSVRDLRGKSAQVWRDLFQEKEMVITSNGRPVAILSAVNEKDLEACLAAWRRARATQVIAAIQYESTQKGTDKTTMGDIDAEIKKVRKARRARVK
jgi:antitoxin (DNA-binding transcriptional repressor) of toxin-antitoxin stability system